MDEYLYPLRWMIIVDFVIDKGANARMLNWLPAGSTLVGYDDDGRAINGAAARPLWPRIPDELLHPGRATRRGPPLGEAVCKSRSGRMPRRRIARRSREYSPASPTASLRRVRDYAQVDSR